MSFLIPTNAVQIARFANGLYGAQLGFASTNGIVSDVSSGGLLGTFNNYYSLTFGAQTTASVASQIIANLGIVAGSNGQTASSVSVALAYVTGQLNAAAPAARGAAVKAVLDLWSSISADPVNGATYGAAATTWNNQISKAVQYAGAVNPDVTIAAASLIPAAPVAVSLTTGLDTVIGSGTATNNVSGTANAGTATFTSGDAITGGAGTTNNLNISDAATAAGSAWVPTSLSGVTVSGVQNATFTSGVNAVTANTTSSGGAQGWSGLTQLNINAVGGATITTAATTVQSVTDGSLAGNSDTLNGGSNVNLTASGITTGGTISVGASTAPVGTIAVTTTQTAGTTSNTNDLVRVTGGTVDAITVNMSAPVSATFANVGNTGNTITVTGAAASTVAGGNATGTTSVSATQSRTTAPTQTLTLPALAANAVATITTTNLAGSANIYTVTAGATGATASQVAQLFAGSTALSTAIGQLKWTVIAADTLISSTVAAPSTSSTLAPLWTLGAASGNTIVLTQNIGSLNTSQTVPTLGGTNAASTPTVTAATGGIYGGIVNITDANGASATAASTIGAVTLAGLAFDPNAVNSTITSNALTNLTVTSSGTTTLNITNNLASPGPRTLNLTTGTVTSLTLNDTNGEITALNITMTGSGSTAAAATVLGTGWGNLVTLTVNGSGARDTFSTSNALSKLTTITISGSASFTSSGLNSTTNFPVLSSITKTSSGIATLTIDPTRTSFLSTSTGQDVVTIALPATKSITAGTAPNDVLIWNAAAPTSLTGAGGTISNFSILGYGTAASGTFNMASMGSAFTAIDLLGGSTTSSQGFSSVNPGTTLYIDGLAAAGQTNTVTYNITGTTGSTATLPLILGFGPTATSSVSSGFTINGLTLTDSAATQAVTNGIGTLTVTSNASLAGQAHTITTLTDASLSTINVSGSAGLLISNFTNAATSLTFNNNSTSTLASGINATGTNWAQDSLTSLTLSGTGVTAFGTLRDNASTLTINQNNTNSTNPVITALTDTNMAQLTVNGTGALTITTDTIAAATFTAITNNSSGLLTVGTLATTAATNLSLGGTGPITISTLNAIAGPVSSFTITDSDSGAVNIPTVTPVNATLLTQTFINSGNGTLTVGATANVIGTSTTTLNLIGNVAYSTSGTSTASGLATITANSDNANINITSTHAGGTALNVQYGNGTNSYTNTGVTAVGQNNRVTVGTGANTISLGLSSNYVTTAVEGTGSNFNINVGAHPGVVDRFVFSNSTAASDASVNTVTSANAQFYIKGAVVGDTIQFVDRVLAGGGTDGYVTANVTTIAQFNANPGVGNLPAAFQSADRAITSRYGVASFTSGGNTYIVTDALAAPGAAANVPNAPAAILAGVTIVEVTGVHTISNLVNGVITLTS